MASETKATNPRPAAAGCPCGHESLFHAAGGVGGCFVPRCACVAFGQGEPEPAPARVAAPAPLPPVARPAAPETATAAEIRAAAREIGRKLWRFPESGPTTGEARAYADGASAIRAVRRNYELSPLAKLITDALLDEIG